MKRRYRFGQTVASVIMSFTLAMGTFGMSAQQTTSQAPSAKSSKRAKGSVSKATPLDTSGADDPTAPKHPAGAAPLDSKLTASVLNDNQQDAGDYIPCQFSQADLKNLSSPEVSPTLTEADAEALRTRVISSVLGENDGNINAVWEHFLRDFTNASLTGKTPSQALATVINDLKAAREFASAPAKETDVASLETTISPLMVTAADKTAFFKYLGERIEAEHPSRYFLGQFAAQAYEDWCNQTANKALKTTAGDIAASIKKNQPVNSDMVVEAVRKGLAMRQRPIDVGCGMSLLSWSEVNHAYGHMIANEYIGVEVMVRNLSRDQEFVLHDVEFAVNADPGGRLGRYFSGRDKIIVRALASGQQSLDPRNIIVHVAQGAGAILSALTPLFGTALTGASGVYNGAFTTSLDKYWKDQSTDQLNLLNDTGFSSAANSQTVVPKSGTVVFVTFIPAKQFEQEWWTQPCVSSAYLGTSNNKGIFKSGATQANSAKNAQGSAIGIDVERTLEVCAYDPHGPEQPKHHWSHKLAPEVKPYPRMEEEVSTTSATNSITAAQSDSSSDDVGKGPLQPDSDLFLNLEKVPYSHWSGNSLAIFRELAHTVVSGMHILSEDQLQGAVTQLKCPTDDSGDLQFATPENDSVACTVNGKNLDKYSKLRLRNASNATDTNTVDGPVTVNGDSANATVAFPTAALRGLGEQVYSVFAVTNSGVEQKTTQTVHLDLSPYFQNVLPTSFDFSGTTQGTQNLTLTGFHLAGINKLQISADKGATTTVDVVTPTSDKQAIFSLDTTKLQPLEGLETPFTLSVTDSNKKRYPVSTQITVKWPVKPVATARPKVPKTPVKPNAPK